jgi:hypothetical protein
MIEAISDRVYRIYMFFFEPFALVCLAFPGRDPLRRKSRKTFKFKSRAVTTGHRAVSTGEKRASAYRQHGFAR